MLDNPVTNSTIKQTEVRLADYGQLYLTGEVKARMYKYGDPLSLNFKLLIDFTKSSGLFAPDDEGNNSALGYLRRIGDVNRYEMLSHWIELVKTLVADYDFLLLGVDGIAEAVSKQNHEFILDSEKIKLNFRESTNMYIQSLITTYFNIAYDRKNKVSVLPPNLRRFDCYIVTFSAGYFNMGLYDYNNPEDVNNPEFNVLPTKRKLSDNEFSLQTLKSFNHNIYEFVGCTIDSDSGSSFLENITNEAGNDFTKNNITFTYRFFNYSGVFNDLTGNNNFYALLVAASIEQKLQQQVGFTTPNILRITEVNEDEQKKRSWLGRQFNKAKSNTIFKNKKLFEKYTKYGSKDFYKKGFKGIKDNITNRIEDKLTRDLPDKLLGQGSVIGRTLEKYSPENMLNNVKGKIDNYTNIGEQILDKNINDVNQFLDKNIRKVENKIYNETFGKINELIYHNYKKTVVDNYYNFPDIEIKNKVDVIENPPKNLRTGDTDDVLNSTGYVRPDNIIYREDLDDEKFVKGTEGIRLFTKEETKNLLGRKGF